MQKRIARPAKSTYLKRKGQIPLFSIVNVSVAELGAPGLEVSLTWEKLLHNYPQMREQQSLVAGGNDVSVVSKGPVSNQAPQGAEGGPTVPHSPCGAQRKSSKLCKRTNVKDSGGSRLYSQ